MSRDFKIALWFWIPVVVGVAFYAPYISGTRQRLNLAVANEERPKVQSLLDSDQRFSNVTTGAYTGQDGALGLYGRVAKDDDLFRLMKAVADLRLRVAINWNVNVYKEAP